MKTGRAQTGWGRCEVHAAGTKGPAAQQDLEPGGSLDHRGGLGRPAPEKSWPFCCLTPLPACFSLPCPGCDLGEADVLVLVLRSRLHLQNPARKASPLESPGPAGAEQQNRKQSAEGPWEERRQEKVAGCGRAAWWWHPAGWEPGGGRRPHLHTHHRGQGVGERCQDILPFKPSLNEPSVLCPRAAESSACPTIHPKQAKTEKAVAQEHAENGECPAESRESKEFQIAAAEAIAAATPTAKSSSGKDAGQQGGSQASLQEEDPERMKHSKIRARGCAGSGSREGLGFCSGERCRSFSLSSLFSTS